MYVNFLPLFAHTLIVLKKTRPLPKSKESISDSDDYDDTQVFKKQATDATSTVDVSSLKITDDVVSICKHLILSIG